MQGNGAQHEISRADFFCVVRLDDLGQIKARLSMSFDHEEIGRAALGVLKSERSASADRLALIRESIVRTVIA